MTTELRRTRMVGLGGFVPERVVKNDDLKQWMDTSDQWIQERTGIRERRWVDWDKKIGSSDLAVEASKRALSDAGMVPKDIQMVIFATLSPDHLFPGTGVFLQRKLGIPVGAAVLDIRQQCTGFIYGTSIADQFIKTGMYDRILVIGAEVHSTGLDLSTRGRDVSVIFGDGAGAAIYAPAVDDVSYIISSHLHADGNSAEDLWTEYPSSKEMPQLDPAEVAEGKTRHFPQMKGRQVFKHAVPRMAESVFEALARNGVPLADLKMLIPHQANLRINEYVQKQILGLPDDRVYNNIQRYGNTTAASIPLALYDCRREGKVQKGDLVCLAAFGAGFTWGSVLMKL
ncbi:MAG: ketoacyl-ACP synthase III [Myxococcales bacterium]|nr:ketoacyl-ACP synthase III [Myxococcales bacterium]